MNRRNFFGWLSSMFAGTVAMTPATKPEPCVTPAYAGFDGSFRLYGGEYRSSYTVRLAKCAVANPKRWGIDRGRMGYWYNEDKSVSKVVWRNADGKLFELQFVPMEEPT